MIYILLPAYNEEENIEAVLKEISAVLKDNKEEFKVIVVNDGSTDSTAEILNQCSSWIPLEVINFEKNKGVGEVFRRGITDICRQAQGDDILISLDCDRTHPAKIFPKLIMALRNGDEIVIASRYHPESKTENLPLLRLMLSDGINLMLRFFYPIKQVKDYTTFFRAYKVSLLKKALAAYGGVLMEQKGFS
ncbi:MAG: glycosyltransferase family 2 protein [Candidatus Omnitrophica bacterium]|nr:glycosyltransferase family 2 protein [Candidatus Omnitrophota bacterium]